MGMSIRGQAVIRQRAEQRAAEKRAREAAEAAAADELRRTMFTRKQAARYLGLSEGTLRDYWAAGDKGPAASKFGVNRQSRVLYAKEELDAWRRDPLNYSRRARPENVGPFEPPQRGNGKRGPKS